MLKRVVSPLLITLSVALSTQANAGLWDDTKELASSAWESTKETSNELKDSAVKKWDEVTSESSSNNANDDESGSLSDIKKLADKETYVKAWEGIKESAKNPDEPNVDEYGVPKQE
ncbi:hypothetical protein [Thiomicrorhabdus sp. Kp2]|uniref:hypothetical protein n=1 Tax=Thiomicrorhabdus sp. Kp2 TaxID=1123518 RepID=UPI000421DF55|nr:hypothetical protein [Thiomicrorhabdus sp. Kp2]